MSSSSNNILKRNNSNEEYPSSLSIDEVEGDLVDMAENDNNYDDNAIMMEDEDDIEINNMEIDIELARKRLKTESELLGSTIHDVTGSNQAINTWKRPNLTNINPNKDIISIQKIECDYTIGNSIELPRYHNEHQLQGQKHGNYTPYLIYTQLLHSCLQLSIVICI